MITQKQLAKTAETFDYLYERWRDESEYEDFADYRTAMAKALPKGTVIEIMTSRPFRIIFVTNGERRYMKIDHGSVTWGRLMKS